LLYIKIKFIILYKMSNFKPKTTKKINVNEKNNITLDRKHNEITNMFFKEEELLPKLIAEKKC